MVKDSETLDRTTRHVREALAGNIEALSWVVGHFTPGLMFRAHQLLASGTVGIEPQDLVHETWVVAIEKLPRIEPRDGRATPPLLRFLSQTLTNRYMTEQARAVRRHLAMAEVESGGADRPGGPDDARQVLRGVCTQEVSAVVRNAIAGLGEIEREVLVLRAFEQRPAREVAESVGRSEAAVHKIYQRALDTMRRALPDSVFDEL